MRSETSERMCLAFRYLGTSRDEEFLHIFLEYVPGGSIAQLLQKFGPFNERVIRSYTRQVLQVCEREPERETERNTVVRQASKCVYERRQGNAHHRV